MLDICSLSEWEREYIKSLCFVQVDNRSDEIRAAVGCKQEKESELFSRGIRKISHDRVSLTCWTRRPNKVPEGMGTGMQT